MIERQAAVAPDFAALRDEFPVTRGWTYLDLANKAPLPQCAQDAIPDFLREMNELGVREAFSKLRVEEIRASLASLLGVAPGTIAFIKNTSEGMNIAAQALDLQAGDNVIQAEMDHPNQVYAWRRLEERGVELKWVRNGEGYPPVEAFVEAMDGRTRVVAVSYVTFGTGCRVDLPALAAACRERGVVLMTDAIQGVGILSASLPALGADIVVCGGHKGLLGLPGTGFLYCREDLIPGMTPPFFARASMVREVLDRMEVGLAPDAHRFEIGNQNYLGLWVLGRSVEFLRKVGLDHIEERVRGLTTYLMELLERRGEKILTPRPWAERAAIVSIESPDPPKAAAQLREKRIIASARNNGLRFAPHFYNTEEELERVVSLL